MQCYKTKHFLTILFLSISASQAWPLLTEVDLAKLSSLTETKRAQRTSKRSVRLIRAWWVPCHVLGSNTATNYYQLCSNTRWVRSTSLCLCSLTLSSAVDKSQQHQVFRRKTLSEICWGFVRIKPAAAGWEPRTLPRCYTAPHLQLHPIHWQRWRKCCIPLDVTFLFQPIDCVPDFLLLFWTIWIISELLRSQKSSILSWNP